MQRERDDACLEDQTLLDLVEGRVDAGQLADIEAHASRCASCREILSALARGDGQTRADGLAETEIGSAPVPRPRAGDALQVGDGVGRYVVRARLGAGGMGVVYAAHDPELDRVVALKVLRPDLGDALDPALLQARMRREAQAMAQLAHPNVVAVYDVGAALDRVFVAMELVDGMTLAEWTRARPRATGELLAAYLAAGRGLAAAHAAGLVHRDFKPENVLVGADGRVRVSDFGLARPASDSTIDPSSIRHVASDMSTRTLTSPGAVLGTPYYMAPEQRRGDEADARSDQYSFCLALYTALYGHRPGPDRRPPAAARRVPAHVRRALARGLSPNPNDRFPAMEPLLAALAGPRSRRLPLVAAALALAAAAAVFSVTAAPPPCQDAARHLAGVWDDARKAAIAGALAATGVPYADETARAVADVVDVHAARWVAMRTEACAATRIHGEQTEEQLALRMTCLDDHLREIAELGDRLLAADRAVAEHAVPAAHRLSDLATCADLTALASPVRPPADLETRRGVATVRPRLVRVKSLRDAGLYAEGLDLARATTAAAAALGYRPLHAEALLLAGRLAHDLGEFARARADLEQSLWAAEASRHDRVAAEALIELLVVIGQEQGRPVEARTLRPRATAVLERLGDPPDLAAALAQSTAAVELAAGELARADDELARALALLEARHGDADLRLAEPLRALAQVALERAQGDRALPLLARALAIQKQVLGDHHPEVAHTLEALAGAYYETSDYERAEAHYLTAQRTYERAFGGAHHTVANVLNNRGLVHLWQGDVPGALALHRQAVELSTRTLGPDHPTTAAHIEGLASALELDEQYPEALALLTRVEELQRARLGPAHARLALTLHSRARVQLELGAHDDALRAMSDSLQIYQRALGRDAPLAAPLRTLGEIHLRRGRPADAVDPLTRAVQQLRPSDDPGEVAWTHALLARALHDGGGDRTRALALARDAAESIAADPRMSAQYEEFARWMADRGLLPRAN